ncbi:MAG: response regulator [Deltaproteobacteria bacterium]|nr:response regulator [Deltaproteobacteria bacterium]
MAREWDRPEEHDHVLVIADDDPVHLQVLRDRLGKVPGRDRASTLGRYPRFEVVTAGDGDEALRRTTRRVTVLAVDLMMPRRGGLDVILQIRPQRSDLAILAFTAAAPPSEAVAAVAAGADHFHQYGDGRSGEISEAIELAIDRRRLVRLLEDSEAHARSARESLAALGAGGLGLPGLRAPAAKEAVLPFEEAAQRYLAAAARLYQGDPLGLAKALDVSYFALRRLLRRYRVPIPTRSRGK